MSIRKDQLKPFYRNKIWLLRLMGIGYAISTPILYPYLAIRRSIEEGEFSSYWEEVCSCFGEVVD